MVRTWTLIGALALGSSIGCGGSSDDDEAEVIPIDQLPERYAAALCDAYARCLGPGLDLFLGNEDCVELTTRRIEEEIPRFEAGIAANRIQYRGERLEACTNDIRSKTCAGLLERESTPCLAALDGTVSVGEECSFSQECAGETYCKFGDSCPGVCAELELAGAACERNGDCASGLECSNATSRCVEPAGENELCQAGEPECAPGFFCAGADADAAMPRPGTCHQLADALSASSGASCDPLTGQFCEPGLVCEIEAVAAGSLTASCASPVGSGAACRFAFPSQCPAGQFCETSAATPLEGTCAPLPAAGEPCALAPYETAGSLCGAYARCENGTCRALAHLGESCSSNAVCYSDHCLGGACVSDSACN